MGRFSNNSFLFPLFFVCILTNIVSRKILELFFLLFLDDSLMHLHDIFLLLHYPGNPLFVIDALKLLIKILAMKKPFPFIPAYLRQPRNLGCFFSTFSFICLNRLSHGQTRCGLTLLLLSRLHFVLFCSQNMLICTFLSTF